MAGGLTIGNMAENEVSSLKVALYNHSLTIAKLSIELEEERKASTTAAEEALSMIMRLQVERAAEKMEASQYKRMSQEKLRHAEDSLACLKQVVQQKDLEIEFLRYKLLATEHRFGAAGLAFGVMGMNDASFLNSEIVSGDKRTGFLARNISMPAVKLQRLCSNVEIVAECDFLKGAYKGCILEECDPDTEQSELDSNAQIGEVERSEPTFADIKTKKNSCHNKSVEKDEQDHVFPETIIDNQLQSSAAISAFPADIEELKERVKRLEEDTSCWNEQIRLSQQMLEQLRTMREHVNNLNLHKPHIQSGTLCDSLTEAMLHFWF